MWTRTCVTAFSLLRRNIAAQTVARLKDVARRISSCLDVEQPSRDRSASLDLLLRFQRLLISKLYPGESGGPPADTPSEWPQTFESARSGWATRRAARGCPQAQGLHAGQAVAQFPGGGRQSWTRRELEPERCVVGGSDTHTHTRSR